MINMGLDGENNSYRKLSIKGERENIKIQGVTETVYTSIHSFFVIVKELVRWLLSIIPRWTRVQSPGSVWSNWREF